MAPRNAEATPAMRKPAISVGKAPNRAMKSDPGSAAIANRIMGRPERTPTSVPDRCRSAWMSAMTGGTARMLSRRANPSSQSSPPATQTSRMALPAAASAHAPLGVWVHFKPFHQSVMRGQKRVNALMTHASISFARRSFRKMDGLAGQARQRRLLLRRAFEPLERFVDLEPARFGLFAFLALAFDHILRRARDEIGIGELSIDAGDVGFDPCHLLLEPGLLGGEIDHPLER